MYRRRFIAAVVAMLGGYVAQELTLVRPRLVRRLVLAGTAQAGRAKGIEFLGRISARTIELDEPVDLAGRDAQLEAITRRGIPDPSSLARLAAVTHPTLVANGDDDPMMIRDNSRLLARHLPNAQLRILPDAGHGFLDQYPEEFAGDVNEFLER